jgi:Domain of unknown function (DUF4331)
MSSHREAPEISKDPVADNTDVYAFLSPDRPDSVTILANFIPLQGAAGGPNFYEFGDDVLYEIHISNRGDRRADITYQFRFTTEITNPDTFLYNTGPIASIDDHVHWTRPQFYSVRRVERRGDEDDDAERGVVLAGRLACPPVNVGVRSTPDYAATFTAAAVHSLSGGRKVFAGQRAEGFHVDLGSIFDLGALRPFQNLHLIPSAASVGVNSGRALNVHSIALQVPIADLVRPGPIPTDVNAPRSVIGVWSSASRQRSRIRRHDGSNLGSGPFVQVSRLANPLFNEVIVPMSDKDRWNALPPSADDQFAKYVEHPELAGLLPVLYPGVFPNLAALKKPRADLVAILFTGIPSGIVPGFQNYTGKVMADQLRLNVAIPPTTSNPSVFGLLGGDAAGFPNGRRVFDDVVSIELRAFAGVTYALVDKTFTPDGAAGKLTEGLTPASSRYQSTFPYLAPPLDGFDTPSS